MAYHLFLRAIYAIGKAGITPVLDGLTLAQLEREGRDKQEYGKERVYGAVSWGIAHILFGPAIDLFGFRVLYATILLSWLGCIITFHLYAKSSGAYCIGSNEVVATCQLIDEKKYRDDQVAIIHDDLEDEKKTPDEPIATYESTVIFEEDGSLSNNDTNANSEHPAVRTALFLATPTVPIREGARPQRVLHYRRLCIVGGHVGRRKPDISLLRIPRRVQHHVRLYSCGDRPVRAAPVPLRARGT